MTQQSLTTLHRNLDVQISKLEKQPHPNQSFIKDLKKRKLHIRDRLMRIGIHGEQLDLFYTQEKEKSKKQMLQLIQKQKRRDKERRAARKRRIHELARKLEKSN